MAATVALLALAAAGGCRPGPDERAVANTRMRDLDLGGHLKLHSYPTSLGVVEHDAAGPHVKLRANGARLLLCLENDDADGDHAATIEISNLSPATLLGCSARREDQRVQLELDPSLPDPEPGRPQVLAEPTLPDPGCTPPGSLTPGTDPLDLGYAVTVPHGQTCADGPDSDSGVSLHLPSGFDAGVVHFGVAGDLAGDTDLVGRIGEAVQAHDLEFLILLGNIAGSDDPGADLRRMAVALGQLHVPVYATVGYDDVSNGGDAVFRELFGPTDSDFVHRQVRFVLLDSADHTLAPTQYDWLDEVLGRDARVTLVFTHTPPFDPHGLRDLGFDSHREAARLMALLQQRQVSALFAGRILSYVATSYAGVPVYITGATGAEQLDEVGPHFLEVQLDSRTPEQPVAVTRIDL